jgi:hypothetical protein
MPYSYSKMSDGNYVVKNKETGEVKGHTTKEKLKRYLAALYIHEGLKDKPKK